MESVFGSAIEAKFPTGPLMSANLRKIYVIAFEYIHSINSAF